VASGKMNGRSLYDILDSGTIRIKGKGNPDWQIESHAVEYERIVKFADGEITDNRLTQDGKTVHHIVFGSFETLMTEHGREITRFRKGTTRAKHGKARRWEKLFGQMGVCHSWYKRGRLIRQKFFYDNGALAYDWRMNTRGCKVKNACGELLYQITGYLDGRNNALEGGHTVLAKPMREWFVFRAPFEVRDAKGKVIYKGQIVNRQRQGLWVVDGKSVCYEHGVEIPKRLYETPPDQLDPKEILSLQNAQARMALMAKIGPERVAEAGKVIHKDGEMRLYSIDDYDVNILRVQCPSTKSYYFLRVPKDSKKCEQARQWTFHVGDGFSEPIKFAVEV
jgi:hypothetical protein